MSRMPELIPDAMSEDQQAVAEEIISGPHGRIAGPFLAWLNSPQIASRARALSAYLRFDSTMPRRLSELAILASVGHWKVELEFSIHAKLALEAGLDGAIIEAMAAGSRPRFQNADEEAVYDLCSEMFEGHVVSDATFDRAVAALGLPLVVEVLATMGYYSMVSITLNAFQMGLPPGEQSPFPN